MIYRYIIYPNGTTTEEITNVYEVDPDVSCPIFTTIPWTGTFVTDTTVAGSCTETIEVLTHALTTAITTVPWAGTYTSTFSTAKSIITESGGTEVITTHWVETATTTTTTSVMAPWTGSYTATPQIL